MRHTAILVLALLAPAALRAQEGARPVRIVIATERLASLADSAQSFALLRVDLTKGQHAAFSGASGYLYVLAGKVLLGSSGAAQRTLSPGEAAYLRGGEPTEFRSASDARATLLHFLLMPVAGSATAYSGSGKISELDRTSAIPALQKGPYEFSLTKVISPPKVKPPLHHRSGAAIYYVLEGSATLHTQSGSEARKAGDVQYEPNTFVHTWENSAGKPLVLLQANISREGTPEIVFLH
jgi:quercetin dioxygenase-like cupin family protein